MLLVLLLFLGVCGPLFLLLFRLLFLLHLPQFLRQNLVVKFVLEFVPVELLDQFLDHGFNWDQLLIDFVKNFLGTFFELFSIPISVRPAIGIEVF